MTEVDGVMRLELMLAPGTREPELYNLTMEIPLGDEMAPIWYSYEKRIRGNPAGTTPVGTGEICRSE